ncbi:hypothetical protein THRCLA_08333, partial [Thraustotheca clavata]
MSDVLDEAVAKRRQYLRVKQMLYRSKIAAEIDGLKAEVDRLQLQLAHQMITPSSKALPWKDVSIAMEEDNKLKLRKNKQLKLQEQMYRRLVSYMHKWALQVIRSPKDSQYAWRHSFLPQDGNTRKLGIDWITQMIYHNTDSMLSKYNFPSIDAGPYHYDFQMSLSQDDLFEYIWRTQKEIQLPFDQ